uniref:Uncharacterized protein n=1 Tax=Parascaris univalens TaxID=6257 RepID=A0A915C6A4_PARUN
MMKCRTAQNEPATNPCLPIVGLCRICVILGSYSSYQDRIKLHTLCILDSLCYCDWHPLKNSVH